MGKVLNLVLVAPATDALFMMLLAFLVSRFWPLSNTRATAGQTVIGVGTLAGLLQAAVMLADIPQTVVGFGLMTYVYMRYRRVSRRAGFWMAFAANCVQNSLGVVALIIQQRWFTG